MKTLLLLAALGQQWGTPQNCGPQYQYYYPPAVTAPAPVQFVTLGDLRAELEKLRAEIKVEIALKSRPPDPEPTFKFH